MNTAAPPDPALPTTLQTLIQRPPIALTAEQPIRRAIELMGEHNAGSVAVVDQDQRPIGLLTQTDVVRRIVLGNVPLDAPLGEAMTRDPVCLPLEATVFDAAFSMASHGFRHLLLVDAEGRLAGVISQRDLFRLTQCAGAGFLQRTIANAEDLATLRTALAEMRQSALQMLAQGIGAEQMTQFISSHNDAITRRIIELALRRHALDDLEWAWLAFGSEGREEQTLATDQDNGIVFLAGEDEREEKRQRLLAFAREVNRDLDACGFPLCKGGIMASNPQWCLTLEEWQRRFASWIDHPEPEALLNATIFFDFRPLYGQLELAKRMHEHLFALSRADQAFQKMLAINALRVVPPLGLIRDFSTETDEHGEAYIDLKKSGARLFVDAARVLALAHGIPAASTVRRLRESSTLPGGVGEQAEAMIAAFHFIQLQRLRHQHQQAAQGLPGDNRLYVDRLNELDRRILKEAFRQAKSLQQRLKLNYQI